MIADIADRVGPLAYAVRSQTPGFRRVESDSVHLDATVSWLCHSQDVTGTGGSAATYNLVLGWEDPYPETSGYSIPTLFEYAAFAGDDDVRQRAVSMAEWVRSTQNENGSFPGGTGADGESNAFNTGQILLGLVEAYERTGAETYRTAIRDACDWLVEAQTGEGHWAPYDYKSQPHVYTTRVSWALLVGAGVLDGDGDRYRETARRNLKWVVDNQRPNGWFDRASFEESDEPYLHTIAYTIRGLIESGHLLEDDAIFEAGKSAADILLDIQETRGVLKGAYDENWNGSWYYCLTGNAQMAIIWARLYELTGEQAYLLAARTSVQFLKPQQPLSGPPAVRGGLPGSYPLVGKYLYLRYPNWAVKFFADALLKLRQLGNRAVEERSDFTEQNHTESESLRMCLLVDGEYVFRWVAEAIAELLSETDIEISLVVINEDTGMFGSDNVKRGLKYPAYAAFWLLSNQFKRGNEPRYDDSVHISEIPGVGDAEWVRTYPDEVSGLWNELPAEVVAKIRSQSDIVFRRGFGLLRGEVLTATEYGVLSYHHGDPRKYRGGPAGFWEFMHDETRAGMMVQSLHEKLDAGTVLSYSEVDISDCDSWGEIRAQLYPNSTHLLTEAVERLTSQDGEPIQFDEHGPVYNPPSARELATFFTKRIRRR